MNIESVIGVFSFCFGAVIASFLNVVIWRVPRGESIVSPPSHCPKCNAAIRWYQNIPILSWIALRGKCANCRAPISPRYILIEALGGCLFLAAYRWMWIEDTELWMSILHLSASWLWISLMIVGSMIDFDHKLLPDFVTVGGMILGVVYHGVISAFIFLEPQLRSTAQYFDYPIVLSLVGLAFGFGLLWLIRFLGSKAFKREAMGLGDVFLMGAVGALFGPMAVLVTLILSSVIGSVVGVSMLVISKTRLGKFVEIPYGPYICLGCLAYMFFGAELVGWYLSILKVS